ncbi:MAG: hypothetical protein WBO55_02165 [Rhizobiaceae bacterium]
MADWGRDSSRVSAPAGSRSPAAVILVALVILLAGGFFAWRYSTGALTGNGEIAVLQQRIGELETQLAAARQEAGSSNQNASANVEVLERAVLERDERIELLRNQLEEAGKVDVTTLERELASRDKALTDADERFRSMQGRLQIAEELTSTLQSELDALKKSNAADLQRAVSERDRLLEDMNGEIERLSAAERELRSLKASIASKDNSGSEAATARLAELETGLEAARAEIARRDRQISDMEAAAASLASRMESEVGAAQKEADSLREQIAALEAQARESAAARDDGATASKTQSSAGGQGKPRDPLRVASAITNAKGLSGLTNAQRDQIATGLILGECVSSVLSQVFGRAPAVAVRDLILSLESDC